MAASLDEHPQPKLIIVYDYDDSSKSFEDAIESSYQDGYGLISYPLVDSTKDTPEMIESYHRQQTADKNTPSSIIGNVPFNFNTGTPSHVFQSIYGKTSQWIDFTNKDAQHSASYLQLLIHQIDWAVHLEIYYLILPPPKFRSASSESNESADDGKMEIDHESNGKTTKSIDDTVIMECAVNYASAILSATGSNDKLVFWIPIPFNITGWKLWKKLSILLRNHKALRPGMLSGDSFLHGTALTVNFQFKPFFLGI